MNARRFPSPRAAFFAGLRDALGVPAIVLGSSFIGLAALANKTGMGLALTVFSTATIWALPGQIVLIEMYGLGATALAVILAVMLTNARFLPMMLALLPHIDDGSGRRGRFFLAAQLVAVTIWAAVMKVCPTLPQDQRLPYYFGYALLCWSVSLVCTALGFELSGTVPRVVTLGLVFLNPIYFMLVFSADVRHRPGVLALVIGAVVGPVAYVATPEWSLLITGAVAGTAAYVLDRRMPRDAG